MYIKKFKAVSLFLIISMILMITSACIQQTPAGTAASEGTKAAVTTTGAEVIEPAVLRLYSVRFREADVLADNYIVKELEKRTNTKLDIVAAPPEEAEQKLNIALASGERPDIITYGTETTEKNLAEAGLLLPLNQYFDKMPNLEKSRQDYVWKAMTHQDGNIYAIPNTTDAPATYGTIYRKDWLDKLGLEIPKTLDEYYIAAHAMSNQDPDGNNQKDTYAFGARGSLGSYFDHIFSAYGFLPNYWMERNGELVHGDILPEAKEALKFCKKLYDEGIIDPEFTTDSSSRLTEKTYQGIFGASNYGIYIIDENNIYNHYDRFKEKNPNGELVLGPILEGPGGAFGYREDMAPKGYIKDSILKDTKQLDACLSFIDYLASDEGVMLVNYGIEGEHYTMGADNVVTELITDTAEKKKLGINQFVMVSKTTFYQTSSIFQKGILQLNDFSVPNPVAAMNVQEVTEYTGDTKDIMYASFFKMITGEIDIEGGFEEYVKQWKNAGGDKMIEAVNEQYKNMR